jgi:hypothetical protein
LVKTQIESSELSSLFCTYHFIYLFSLTTHLEDFAHSPLTSIIENVKCESSPPQIIVVILDLECSLITTRFVGRPLSLCQVPQLRKSLVDYVFWSFSQKIVAASNFSNLIVHFWSGGEPLSLISAVHHRYVLFCSLNQIHVYCD